MLYFDHNATHPLSDTAREAWLRATRDFIGNPSSPHRLGGRAEKALDEARAKMAAWLGCSPLEVVWTSGATEANNAVLHHAAGASEGEVWISAIEHPCVHAAAARHFAKRLRLIPVNREGVVEVGWLANELRYKAPALVAVMAANNETGVLQPWREILASCRQRGVAFLTDAAQWLGKMPAAGLGGADFVSGCAHKFGGPLGVGFLKVPGDFRPLLVGGPQEEGRRAGTENVAGVLAMIAALEEREARISCGEPAERTIWRAQFERELRRVLPGAEIVGSAADRLWNTVSALMPGLPDCRQRWVVKLDKLGFAVSTGSACASGKETPSHVLSAMNLQPEQAARALRFSAGWETTREDWTRLLVGLQQAAAELQLIGGARPR